MSGNYAKRGCGSHNPNSRKASHQERKNNNNSDNSSSDGKNTVQQKRNRTITENSMEEDYVADDQMADVGVDGKDGHRSYRSYSVLDRSVLGLVGLDCGLAFFCGAVGPVLRTDQSSYRSSYNK
ncbi:hypothetical protein GLOIN_2v1673942 [Rhizophagus irregularis DAOM 181602=DAOM 197198]|uniref:Uncharacterized protein n=1 Tax=Rhizophagus irregularis (strain DAOM 197198w) TaxID=1432141 RepID=A0A015KWS6_RHIIW|nr:hypothetical protein RirG_142440 [Rhizophagus irregularis DAOM 197198w]GET63154.1 hypothetical protein GLOIN_2v1673942 [Rhizophagus irregularis DAOM 181602=DAOM 197198]